VRVFCTSTSTPMEGSTAEISSTARMALDNLGRHLLGFVHLSDERRDLFPRELANSFLEDLLFGGKRGKRRGEGGFSDECGHGRGISENGLRSYSTRG
jgi:hypothetical protein